MWSSRQEFSLSKFKIGGRNICTVMAGGLEFVADFSVLINFVIDGGIQAHSFGLRAGWLAKLRCGFVLFILVDGHES